MPRAAASHTPLPKNTVYTTAVPAGFNLLTKPQDMAAGRSTAGNICGAGRIGRDSLGAVVPVAAEVGRVFNYRINDERFAAIIWVDFKARFRSSRQDVSSRHFLAPMRASLPDLRLPVVSSFRARVLNSRFPCASMTTRSTPSNAIRIWSGSAPGLKTKSYSRCSPIAMEYGIDAGIHGGITYARVIRNATDPIALHRRSGNWLCRAASAHRSVHWARRCPRNASGSFYLRPLPG